MGISRKKGRGRNKWRVFMKSQGRQHEWIVTGSHADAEELEARKKLELAARSPGSDRVVPQFSNFCVTRYRTHAETHLRKSTWSVRQYQLATLIEFFGEKQLHRIGPEDIEGFKAHRREEGAKPRSINNELAVLRAVLTHARKRLKLPVPELEIPDLPVIGRGRVTFWNDDQMRALFEAIEKYAPDLMGVVVFIANTGCRKGEALALEWPRVDLKRKIVTIEPNEEWQPKDNEPREIPIGRAVMPWVKTKRRASKRWVFPASTGERFAYWPKRAFDRARRLAGHADACALVVAATSGKPKGGRGKKAPKTERTCSCGAQGLRGGPHTLRHTYATHFLRAVPDLYLLSQILGHSYERTTKLYAHLLPDHLERGRDAVVLGPRPRVKRGTR